MRPAGRIPSAGVGDGVGGSALRNRHDSLLDLDVSATARISENLGQDLPRSHEPLPGQIRAPQLGKDQAGFLTQYLNPLPGTPFPLFRQTCHLNGFGRSVR